MLTDHARTRDPIPPGAHVDVAWQVGDSWTSEPWAVLVDDTPVALDDGHWTVTGQVLRGTDEVVHEWTGAQHADGGSVLIGRADVELDDGVVLTTSTVALTHNAAQSAVSGPFTRLRLRVRVTAGAETWTVLWGTATARPERFR